MLLVSVKSYRAGGSVEDYCRACKTDRLHTIIVVDVELQPLRVACGYCDSEHNYRGGPRIAVIGAGEPAVPVRAAGASTGQRPAMAAPERARTTSLDALPLVSDRERSAPTVSVPSQTDDLELLLRRIIREEAGVWSLVPGAN